MRLVHAIALSVLLASATTQAGEVTVGIVPQQAAAKLARLWTPLLAEIGRSAGLDLRFRTAPDIPEFERRVRRGEYDVAYLNPYHYTVFSRSPGYRALAKQADKRIRGLLVVHRDSPVQAVSDLDGGRLAFPAPAAFAASVLPRAALSRDGVRFEAHYVSSHDSVYRAVAKGLFPAGGGIERTLANVDPATREQLRVLWRTEPYTPHAIATHPRVDDGVRERLLRAMVALADTAHGRELLAAIRFRAIEPATDAEWNDVRGLGLDVLSHLESAK